MNDAKKILPIARGNVWTGMPSFEWPLGKADRGCVRNSSRTNPRITPGLPFTLIHLMLHVRSADSHVRANSVGQIYVALMKEQEHADSAVRAPRSVGQRPFLVVAKPLPVLLQSNPRRMMSFESQCTGSLSKYRRRIYFATLVLRHATLRILLHLAGMMRRPRNWRWHLRCIGREFYGRLRKK